jgi:hypothetical protein
MITLTSYSSLRHERAIEGGSPLRFYPYGAATRCRAGYEKDSSKLSMRPKDRYRYVAYSTPSSKHPERMILGQCSCDLHFVATPLLQNPGARRMPKSVMSAAFASMHKRGAVAYATPQVMGSGEAVHHG